MEASALIGLLLKLESLLDFPPIHESRSAKIQREQALELVLEALAALPVSSAS